MISKLLTLKVPVIQALLRDFALSLAQPPRNSGKEIIAPLFYGENRVQRDEVAGRGSHENAGSLKLALPGS